MTNRLVFLILGTPSPMPFNYSRSALLSKVLADKGFKTYFYNPNSSGLFKTEPIQYNLHQLSCVESYIEARALGVKTKLKEIYNNFENFLKIKRSEHEDVVIIYFDYDSYYEELIQQLKNFPFKKIICVTENVPFLVSAGDFTYWDNSLSQNHLKEKYIICSFATEHYELSNDTKYLLEQILERIYQLINKKVIYYIYSGNRTDNSSDYTKNSVKKYPLLNYNKRLNLINYSNFILIPYNTQITDSNLNLIFTSLWYGTPVFNMSNIWPKKYNDVMKHSLLEMFSDFGGVNLYNNLPEKQASLIVEKLSKAPMTLCDMAKKLKPYETTNLVNEILLTLYKTAE